MKSVVFVVTLILATVALSNLAFAQSCEWVPASAAGAAMAQNCGPGAVRASFKNGVYSSAYASLSAADAACTALSKSCTLFIDQDATLAADTVLHSAHVYGWGGILRLGAFNLTCSCWAPPNLPMFAASGSGVVTFSNRPLIEIKWFGAVVDGVSNDQPADQAALYAAGASGASVHFPAGTTYVGGLHNWVLYNGTSYGLVELQIPSGVSMQGDGNASHIACENDWASSGTLFTCIRGVDNGIGLSNVKISDITIDSAQAPLHPSMQQGHLSLWVHDNVTLNNVTSNNANGQAIQTIGMMWPEPNSGSGLSGTVSAAAPFAIQDITINGAAPSRDRLVGAVGAYVCSVAIKAGCAKISSFGGGSGVTLQMAGNASPGRIAFKVIYPQTGVVVTNSHANSPSYIGFQHSQIGSMVLANNVAYNSGNNCFDSFNDNGISFAEPTGAQITHVGNIGTRCGFNPATANGGGVLGGVGDFIETTRGIVIAGETMNAHDADYYVNLENNVPNTINITNSIGDGGTECVGTSAATDGLFIHGMHCNKFTRHGMLLKGTKIYASENVFDPAVPNLPLLRIDEGSAYVYAKNNTSVNADGHHSALIAGDCINCIVAPIPDMVAGLQSTTVASLGRCGPGLNGAENLVGDATEIKYASPAIGGGRNAAQVWCNGAAGQWQIGSPQK